MRSFAIIAIAAIAISPAARAQDNGEAFYDAFKALCADTGAQPDSVKKAVEAAPFVTPHPSASMTVPYPMTTTAWDITWNNRKFTINGGTAHFPDGDMVSCDVISRANEDAGIAAVRKWVGVQPSTNYPSSGTTLYDYREDGSARTALVGDAAIKASRAEGRIWLLTVAQQPNFASVTLSHFLAPVQQNSN